MIDLTHLNPQQKKAVETTEGPLLVLAGAGSGKTSVLTHRIAYILDSGLAGPENVLAVTFTNKAAGEMKERVLNLLKSSENKLAPSWMGTFHSIGLRILKMYGDKIGVDKNFSIYDSSDQVSVTKEAMNRLNLSTKEFKPKSIHSFISSAKNELLTPTDYSSQASGFFQTTASDVYFEYEKILKENNCLDFDDLIMKTLQLLQSEEAVLKKFQEQFKYILVDEYQDTNHAQYIMVNLFAKLHKNICCVGDDDQSIYSFRGATIQNILNFERDYPESSVIKLEQNYRSTKKILEASYQVISQNTARKDKKLWTENDDGSAITLFTSLDEKDESRWILEMIDQVHEATSYSDIAILYRTNAQSRNLEEAFIEYGVPYRIVGGVRFYERKEIKDILAYLKLIYNPKDSQSLGRIINVPRRGIGKKTVQDLNQHARSKSVTAGELLFNSELKITNSKLKDFAKLIQGLKSQSEKLNIIDFINHLLEKTGYIKMLDDGTPENEARIENIKELISVANKFSEEEPPNGLINFLEEVSLLEGATGSGEDEDAVTLMTIHSSKGLEFEHIFVVGMEENLFPHSNTLFDSKELEEERRLAYVAITRAKKHLYLTHASNRMYFGKIDSNPISRFITDIDETLIHHIQSPHLNNDVDAWSTSEYDSSDFKHSLGNAHQSVNVEKGDKVKHEYFGIGTIKYIDDEVMEIDFGPSYGIKELMLEYARVEKV